jgi:hypothetical protein
MATLQLVFFYAKIEHVISHKPESVMKSQGNILREYAAHKLMQGFPRSEHKLVHC